MYIKIWWNLVYAVDGLLAHFYLAHKQIRLHSGDGFGLSTVKFRYVNSESAEHNWNLKGMGDETLIGLTHVNPKTHPLLIQRIGTTLLDHFSRC